MHGQGQDYWQTHFTFFVTLTDKNGTQEHNRLVYCEGCLELVFPEGAAVGPQKISSLGRPRVPVLFSQRRKCQRALEAPSPPEDLACAIPLPAVGTCRTQEHYINALGGDLDTEDSCFKKIQSSFKGCNLYAFLTH